MALHSTSIRRQAQSPDRGLLHVLLAPAGQLSGDGQLRELIQKRRERRGGSGPIWYLASSQVSEWGLGHGLEAVVTANGSLLPWLQLRFGGRSRNVAIPVAWLEREARALPQEALPAILPRG